MADRTRAGAFPARAWIERLIAPLAPGAAILDLGCGGGEPVARFLIDHGFAVTGIDLAASQIDLVQTRFPRHSWLRGAMQNIVLEEEFAAVVAWNCLTWLGDDERAAMLARAAAWLDPGGYLLFTLRADDDLALGDYRDGSRRRADLRAVDYSAELARSGLIEIAHVAADPACDGAGIWLAQRA